MDGQNQKDLPIRQVARSIIHIQEQRMANVNLSVNPQLLSHEIKTPLTSILGLAKELSKQKQQLTPQQRICIEGICKQGDRLFEAVEKFLFNQPTAANDTDISTLDVTETSVNLPILMVEDEPLIQRVHRMMLEEIGYQVDVAKNGKEALEFYSKHQYAAILTDINMPEMDGIEFSAKIRHLETAGNKRIPIIALTAAATNETRQKCLAAGIDEVAAKPIKSDALQALFHRYLGKK